MSARRFARTHARLFAAVLVLAAVIPAAAQTFINLMSFSRAADNVRRSRGQIQQDRVFAGGIRGICTAAKRLHAEAAQKKSGRCAPRRAGTLNFDVSRARSA